MKNLIVLVFMLLGFSYVSKDIEYVPIVDIDIRDKEYYDQLKQKQIARALIVKTKYSNSVIANNN